MDGTMRGRKILLRDLNAHLICVLCGGYYIDATSISECLHTFCRSCIVKYLKTSRFCPICDVQLNSKNPLLSLSQDKTLQRLVYKMVPGLYSSEMARRRNFYHSCDGSAGSSASSADDADVSSCDAPDSHLIDATAANMNGATTIYYSPEDSISLSLEYYNSDKDSGDELDSCFNKKVGPPRRYLKCPAALKMLLLKKFLRTKYGLAPDHKVDIIYADADACLPDDISLMDVAYIFMWNRANPMRFSYRILEWSTVKVPSSFGNTGSATSPQPALTSDAPPDKTRQPPSNRTNEKESSSRGRRIHDDKRRIRESDSETDIRACRQKKQEPKKRTHRESSLKKARSNKKKNALKKKVNNYLKATPIKITPPEAPEESADSLLTKETDIKESIQDKIEACIQDIDQDIDNDISMELLEDQIEEEIVDDEEGESMEVDVNKPCDSIKENEKINNVDEKMKDDFALRDKQNDNDDLEDDDDFRLRISASEEDCAQEETPATVKVDTETHIQVSESRERKERKESLKRNGEFKIKRKNKKAKHHHHHRHHDRRRDHHPPAATILPSADTRDNLKLKVKLTTIKPDELSKHHQKYNSQSPSRHHTSKHKISYHVISDDNESGSNSPSNSNELVNSDEEKTKNTSQVVENGSKSNDSLNRKPSVERTSPIEKPKVKSPILVNSSTDTETDESHTNGGHCNNKMLTSNSILSNKEKLLQMRSIRHKPVVENNLQNFRSMISNNNNNNNINKNNNNEKDNDSDVIEIEEIKTSNSTILIPPSAITVSKITAAEKRKMDEEKLLKMSGKGPNEIDNKRPALEIMLVEAPPQTKNPPVKHTQEEKKQEDRVCNINTSKINSSVIPIVKLQKSINLQQNGRHSLLTIAQKLNNTKTLNNKSPSIGVNKSSQAIPNNIKDMKSKQQKTMVVSEDVKSIQDSNGSPLNRNKSPGSHDTVALDLSDKSSRKGSSPASSISSDGCPSPSSFYSIPPQLNERSIGQQPKSGCSAARSPVSNASMSPASSSPKNSSEVAGNGYSSGMRNLLTLCDTASQIRDMMSTRDTADRFQQLARSHNFQQKQSPQHFHSPQQPEPTPPTVKLPQAMLSPSTRAVLAQSSPPTHLKIPVPRALPINSKMVANRNGTAPIPDLSEVTINRNRGPVTLNSFQNRNNGMISRPGPNQAVRHIPNPSIVSFRQNQMKNMASPMTVRPFSPPKKLGVNGRTHVMPPPPPAIPLASIRRMESMTRSLNIEKVAAGLQVKAAVEAGFRVQ